MKHSYYFWHNGVRYCREPDGTLRMAVSQVRWALDGDSDESGLPCPPTVVNPFYIGSANLLQDREQGRDTANTPRHTMRTVEEAIAAAQRRLSVEPHLTEVSIVKIVRVVRRKKVEPPPSAVEIEVVA